MKIENWKFKIADRKGLTLLELTVVMAIIIIMTSVVLVGLGESRTKKELQAAAREVEGAIREAQNYALTGKNASATCGSIYTFTYTSGSDAYGISDCVTADYNLKNNVKFINDGEFSFVAPWGNITITNPPSAPFPAIIDLQKGSHCLRISVSISGSVTESACP